MKRYGHEKQLKHLKRRRRRQMLSHSEVNRGAVEIFSVDDDPVNQVTSPQTRHVPIHQRTPSYQTRRVPANFFNRSCPSPSSNPSFRSPVPHLPTRGSKPIANRVRARLGTPHPKPPMVIEASAAGAGWGGQMVIEGLLAPQGYVVTPAMDGQEALEILKYHPIDHTYNTHTQSNKPTHPSTHPHACVHARVHTHTRTHAHTQEHTHTHARNARTHARTHARRTHARRTHTRTHARARTHARMYARTHARTHTHTGESPQRPSRPPLYPCPSPLHCTSASKGGTGDERARQPRPTGPGGGGARWDGDD